MEHNRCILETAVCAPGGALVVTYLGVHEPVKKPDQCVGVFPLVEATCISCGTCFQVSPTPLLGLDRWACLPGKETDVEHNAPFALLQIGCVIDVQNP